MVGEKSSSCRFGSVTVYLQARLGRVGGCGADVRLLFAFLTHPRICRILPTDVDRICVFFFTYPRTIPKRLVTEHGMFFSRRV